MEQNRKVIDCGAVPNEVGCTLKISGTETEVLQAARDHAIASHGHHDGPELESLLRSAMRDEAPAPA